MFTLADAQLLLNALSTLDRIDQNTSTLGEQMATINEALTALANSMAGLEEDVARVLAALANENLSPEAQAAVDALQQRFDTLNATLDAAVPPPPA